MIPMITGKHADPLGLGVTPSGLNPPFNAVLDGFSGLHDWRLMSNVFDGERPNGAWSVQVVDLASSDYSTLKAKH